MRYALAGLLVLACACSDTRAPVVAPPVEVAPAVVVEEPAPVPTDFVITSTLHFVTAPDAPHRLRVTYQAPGACRWDLMRLNDVDGDRRIEYQYQGHAYEMPQDYATSVEFGPDEARDMFARTALRRLVFTDDPAGPGWESRELGEGLGQVRRKLEGDGTATYEHRDAAGQVGERLTVRERFESAGRSWPRRLDLAFSATQIWSETVDKIQTQSWFADAYFVPPDRVSVLSPK